MPARSGNWPLLGHDSDPVAGDPDRLHDLISYYTKMADTITSEAAVLERIGSGDTSELLGESADAIRKRSKDVSKSLTQTSGRYEAVASALATYAPALDEARSETAKAVAEAEAAAGAKTSSAAMADPSQDRPKDAPPLTDDENAQVHARETAMADASDAVAAARARMDSAMSALNAAGQAAARVIKGSFDDGLVDTWQYKLREGFLKFLKMIVKVFMWIGVALAVLAFFIPGLGALALAGAAVAVMSLAASTVLAAMGEGSWLDVILGAVSVLMLGAGVLISKAIVVARSASLAKGASVGAKIGTPGASTIGTLGAKYTAAATKFAAERKDILSQALAGKLPITNAMERIKVIDQRLANIKINGLDDIAKDFAVKPQFWQFTRSGYLKEDWGKIKEFGSGYRFDRLYSVDSIGRLKETQTAMWKQLGVQMKPIPTFYYFQAGRAAISQISLALTLGRTPTGLGGDDANRFPGYADAQTTLTTPKP